MNRFEAAAVEIRRLEENDRVAWEDLWQENLDHFAAPDRARADMPVIWQRLMDQAAPLLGWLVLRQGRAAGLAHVVLRQHSFSTAQIAILEDLWIAPFVRGHGLAERLVERLVREGARRAGAASNGKPAMRTTLRSGSMTGLLRSIRSNATGST